MYHHLLGLGYTHPKAIFAMDAARGDILAIQHAIDFCEEEGIMLPFQIGQGVFVQTLTLYFVGEIIEVGHLHLRLKNASWVHWTGRLSTLFATKNFAHTEFPDDERKPRTEFIGECCVPLGAVNMWADWPADKLPTTSIL